MFRPGTISVLMAFNAEYAPHGAACMASLLRNSQASFDFVIASSGSTLPFADRIRRSFAGNDRVTIEFRTLEMPCDTHFPLPYTLTLETYLRFWISELLPGRARALYLDPDTIVTGDIDALWQTDLQGNVLAAVPIPNSTRPQTHGMATGSLFFNAGVLLFDLDAWRERNYRDRCLAYLRAHPERAIDGDQDILNLCTAGDWLPLPYEWNVINPFYRMPDQLGLTAAELERVRRHARIVHFNGRNKPWRYLDDHPRKADYLQNLAQTDWRDWHPPDFTVLNRVRKHLAPYLPSWAKRNSRAVFRTARAFAGLGPAR